MPIVIHVPLKIGTQLITKIVVSATINNHCCIMQLLFRIFENETTGILIKRLFVFESLAI